MCLALYKPAGIQPDWTALEEGMCHNSDGAGFAVAVDGQLIIEKGFFKFADFKKAFAPFGEYAAIVHFRMATHGAKNQANCHPFALADFGMPEDATPIAVIHNGIFSSAASDQKQWSDTWHVCRDVLHPLWTKHGNCFGSKEMLPIGDGYVGTSNKLVFLSADGSFSIWGESNGHWNGGVWYSNHSYEGYGARWANPLYKGSTMGYPYDEEDDYYMNYKPKKPAISEPDEDVEFEGLINYELEATAIEQALVEELRDCGYGEEDIEKLYIHQMMVDELADIYQLTPADIMTAATTRVNNDGLVDAEVTTEEPIANMTTLPVGYTFVGKGAVRSHAGAKIDGSVMGWNPESGNWCEAAGILETMDYAVRKSAVPELLGGESLRATKRIPKGYAYLGVGPVQGTQPLVEGDILRWSPAYEKWTNSSGLLSSEHYAARIGCGAFVASAKPPVALEVGECYVARNGKLSSPVEINRESATCRLFPFRTKLGEDLTASSYTATGRFTLAGASERDLISKHNMKLEVGKRYLTRDGRATSPTEENLTADGQRSLYPFKVRIGTDGHYTCFAENGRWKTSGLPYKTDLVKELPFLIEAGKRYITRNGTVTSPAAECINGRHLIELGDGLVRYYLPIGRMAIHRETEYDLMEEYTNQLVLEVGKSYQTADGRVVVIESRQETTGCGFFGRCGQTTLLYSSTGKSKVGTMDLVNEFTSDTSLALIEVGATA